jgi:hypothetical protein
VTRAAQFAHFALCAPTADGPESSLSGGDGRVSVLVIPPCLCRFVPF